PGRLPEAEPRVQAVRVGGGQQEAAQALQLRMGHHRGHQLLAETTAAVLRQDEDIGQVAEGGAIGDDAGEGHLAFAFEVAAEAQRAGDRPLHRLPRDALAPVRLPGEETVDQVDIQFAPVVADAQLAHRHSPLLKPMKPSARTQPPLAYRAWAAALSTA